jgi:hypothetical protein
MHGGSEKLRTRLGKPRATLPVPISYSQCSHNCEHLICTSPKSHLHEPEPDCWIIISNREQSASGASDNLLHAGKRWNSAWEIFRFFSGVAPIRKKSPGADPWRPVSVKPPQWRRDWKARVFAQMLQQFGPPRGRKNRTRENDYFTPSIECPLESGPNNQRGCEFPFSGLGQNILHHVTVHIG